MVDDNLTSRSLLEKWLTRAGLDCTSVADDVAALTALRHGAASARPYAVALLDASVYGVKPYLVARIREEPEFSLTRLILLTSADRATEIERQRHLGVSTELPKPISEDELGRALERALSSNAPPSPVYPASARNDRRPEGTRNGPTVPLRVLIAEDNALNAQLIVHLVASRGHSVSSVRNGRDALAQLAKHDFDLLLVDLHMPELDGFEVVRALREREAVSGAHLPTVALTARSRAEDRQRCLAAGMDDFLVKPIDRAALWARWTMPAQNNSSAATAGLARRGHAARRLRR